MVQNLGQLHPGTANGKLLKTLAEIQFVKSIVEVGTLDGTGSTLSILKGITARVDHNQVAFYSIEANRAAYELAKINLSPLPECLHLIYGSLLDTDSPLLVLNMTEQETLWWKSDLDYRVNAPNVMQELPASIDLLLLDGSEFSGFNDFLKLGERSKIVVMDDVSTRKNRLSRQVSTQLGFVEIYTDGRFSVFCHCHRANELFASVLKSLSDFIVRLVKH